MSRGQKKMANYPSVGAQLGHFTQLAAICLFDRSSMRDSNPLGLVR